MFKMCYMRGNTNLHCILYPRETSKLSTLNNMNV